MSMLTDMSNQSNTSLTHTTDSRSSMPPTCQRDQLQFMPSLLTIMPHQSLLITPLQQCLTGEFPLTLTLMAPQSQSQRPRKSSPLNTLTSLPSLKPRPASTTTTNAPHTTDTPQHQ